MNKICVLECIDKNGIENSFDLFEASITDEDKLHFFVGKKELGDFFELVLERVSDQTHRISNIKTNKLDYSGKGIPEALFSELHTLFNITITSSSKIKEYQEIKNEKRWPPADKMWNRLVGKKLAKYDQKRDIYTFTG